MSMHEINTAAETITAAADPDANIIFGATINPELEGEIIITVVATGFDASYFAGRQHVARATAEEPAADTGETDVKDEAIAGLDMDLGPDQDDVTGATDFHSEPNTPNIWTLDNNHTDSGDDSSEEPEVSATESELDKPSFLRRRFKKDKGDKSDKKEK